MGYELTNETGIKVVLLEQGAAIQAIRIPVAGKSIDTVLGYDDLECYRTDPYYLGATLGRFAGRIRDGEFLLNGQVVRLDTDPDSGNHTLHGGPDGLYARRWDLDDRSDRRSAIFSYLSQDGDQGFPGELIVTVRYSLDEMSLRIDLSAISAADTVVNLSNHAYFNLGCDRSIDSHEVSINADAYTPIDDDLIPTGVIESVVGTPFDLRAGVQLGERLQRQCSGFDHNFVLNKKGNRSHEIGGCSAELAATAYCRETGIRLNVFTTQPGLQFYTGQALSKPFKPFQGFCFEAQGFPNAPNEPTFPSTVLRAGEQYRQIIVYQFEVDNQE